MVKTMKMLTSIIGVNECHKPKKNTKRGYDYRVRKFYKRPATLKNYSKNLFKSIILFSHELGQRKQGVETAPLYLKKYINVKNHKFYNVKNTGNLFQNINNLYKMNKKVDGPRINIGGDHSMSIATIADTLNRYHDAKVIYFDAHTDINTYESSITKNYHGMPLSFLTGLDHNEYFDFIKHKLKFDNLLYIGIRCLDLFEKDLVYERNIKYIEPKELNNNFENTMNKILEFAGNSPIHLSFDVDCIDKQLVESSGTTVDRGIKMKIGKEALKEIKKYTNVVNVDITELNMYLDTSKQAERSGKNIVQLFRPFFA